MVQRKVRDTSRERGRTHKTTSLTWGNILRGEELGTPEAGAAGAAPDPATAAVDELIPPVSWSAGKWATGTATSAASGIPWI